MLVRNDVETVNEAKKQLQKISEPQPKKKKQAMVITTSLNEQKLKRGVFTMA